MLQRFNLFSSLKQQKMMGLCYIRVVVTYIRMYVCTWTNDMIIYIFNFYFCCCYTFICYFPSIIFCWYYKTTRNVQGIGKQTLIRTHTYVDKRTNKRTNGIHCVHSQMMKRSSTQSFRALTTCLNLTGSYTENTYIHT